MAVHDRGVTMILLTGATGSVGRHVAADLIAKGLDVRVVVRDPETADLPAGVEVMRGDLVDPESLSAALVGVDAVSWTFLRPTGFTKNTLEWADQIRIGAVRGPYGEAARSLIDEGARRGLPVIRGVPLLHGSSSTPAVPDRSPKPDRSCVDEVDAARLVSHRLASPIGEPT